MTSVSTGLAMESKHVGSFGGNLGVKPPIWPMNSERFVQASPLPSWKLKKRFANRISIGIQWV